MELIGRERELADVRSRLGRRRLVTVTGPGGIGKTRLARAAIDGFDRPVAVVDLTKVDRGGHVDSAVLDALGYGDLDVALGDTQPVPLLVLDNCEHVLDATATLVERMLERRADLVTLATSRSPLEVEGESVVSLGPLATDGTGERNESLELFIACTADRGFDAESIDDSDVEAICRRLDGVPLAIEIAAARLGTYSTGELLAALDRDPHSLARPRFRGRASHRSVQDLVESSLDLLAPDAAATFDELGVFAGPFTREAAVRLIDRTAVADHLEELIHASLVVSDVGATAAEYRLLYPVRAVAIERLRRDGRWNAVMDRLVDDTQEQVSAIIADAAGGWDEDALAQLRSLYLQIIAALDWVIDRDETGERGLVLTAVLWGLVHQGHVGEIVDAAQRTVDRWPDPDQPWYADAVATVATGLLLAGDAEGAIDHASSALPHADASMFAPATLRRSIGQAHQALGRVDEAIGAFRDAAAQARRLGVTGFALEIDVHVGLLLASRDVDAGVAVIEAAIDEATRSGAGLNVAYARVARASAELARNPQLALELGEDALALTRRVGFPAAVSQALYTIAAAQLGLGHDRRAATTLLDLFNEIARRRETDLRPVIELAAELARRTGSDAWPTLSATAASYHVTMSALVIDVGIEFADTDGRRPLPPDELLPLLRTLLEDLAGTRDAVDGATDAGARRPSDDDGSALHRNGEVWTVEFSGARTQLSHSKGINDLAKLLAAPGREFAAVDLMGAMVSGSGATPSLDARARREYESRIVELQGEIDEADHFNDAGRVGVLQDEMDQLVEQLSSALGLGGRTRRTGTEAERARTAVTHRLRSTIKRFDDHLPSLAEHLRTTITTGAFCSYRPADQVSWTVSFGAGDRR